MRGECARGTNSEFNRFFKTFPSELRDDGAPRASRRLRGVKPQLQIARLAVFNRHCDLVPGFVAIDMEGTVAGYSQVNVARLSCFIDEVDGHFRPIAGGEEARQSGLNDEWASHDNFRI